MTLFAAGLGLVLVGGVAALALDRVPTAADRWFRWNVVAGCLLALVPAVAAFTEVPSHPLLRSAIAPAGAAFPFAIDRLSAWFLFVVLGVGAAIAAYGAPYLGRERGHRNVGLAHLLVATLLAGLAGVVTARTVLAFLVSWEVMALSAYFLVIFEHEQREAWNAGMIYLVLTHVSTLALLGMFAVWAGGNTGCSFEELARRAPHAGSSSSVILGLGLLGFGIKAGVIPFHFWLPGAHAAAPSHVSALLSGVVLKIGIYGLFRMLALLGPPPAWWGWTLLLLGLASAVLGVLWALAQHDLKRLLAYHSVENIGIILLGLGLGGLGTAYGQPVVALLGYTGALLHTLNHALFKSLLFLGAGAVAHVTGTREIDRLGGLARRMPRTAIAFLVGSIAIVGLPPLNGFVSEWLIFQGLLSAGASTGTLRVAILAAAGLALTGGLALACFTKLFGVVFLGVARDPAVAPSRRESADLVASPGILATCCVVIGVAPAVAVMPAMNTVAALIPASASADSSVGWFAGTFAISGSAVAAVALGALLWLVLRARRARRPQAIAPTWACAYAGPSGRMQYTAASYADPLLTAFGGLSGSRKGRSVGSLRTHPGEPVLDLLMRPVWKRVVELSSRLRAVQSGGLRWYLLYVILTLLGLLLYLRIRALH